MFNFHVNHKKLLVTSAGIFLALSIMIAVVPAYQMQDVRPLPNSNDLTVQQREGLYVYVAENCMSCHTQQVRNIEMDKIWGNRPSIPSDYYYSKKRMDIWRQSPSLLGSERTGPDLTNVGKRQPGMEWHLLHLFNPRIVVKESVMPGYPWLFEIKDSVNIQEDDIVVPVPAKYLKDKNKKVVAGIKAKNLVAYLQSLQQSELQQNTNPGFIPKSKPANKLAEQNNLSALPDGEVLYMNTCASCHQADGKGLAGAFPPLAGSPIVNDENPETLIKIILLGYDARTEYGVMSGFAEILSDEEIAAIANHERTSWGNKAALITSEEVKRIREYITQLNP